MDKLAARLAVMERMLVHVPFDGWTQKALEKAAQDAGYDRGLVRIFPGGVLQALELFGEQADIRMLDAYAALPSAPAKIRERIATLVRLRLEVLEAHKEAVRRALAAYALPFNAHREAAALGRTADVMWRAAGDASTDFNWYTKRGLLMSVYASTLLFWLNDHSEGYANTWAFLSRRIEDVMKIQKLKAKLSGVTA